MRNVSLVIFVSVPIVLPVFIFKMQTKEYGIDFLWHSAMARFRIGWA